ncbi:MAG: hypothetical protein U0903_07195 [Planctomycetales bacterium]
MGRIQGGDEAELTIDLAQKLLQNGSEQILVFVPSVRETKILAGRIAHACPGLTPAAKIVEELSLVERAESIAALTMTLAHAVAFHNADLTLEEIGR